MNILKLARSSTFIRYNGLFFAGSVAVGVLNYLYYPVMGRMMAPTAFGEVQTLISLFLQMSIFLSVLGLITINIVANYKNTQQRNLVVFELEKVALIASLVLLAATLIGHEGIRRFLQFDSAWPIILLAIALVASVPFTFRGAFLRGKHHFGWASLGNIVSAGGKLLAAIALVGIGLTTAGAIGGLVAAQIAACIYTARLATKARLLRPVGDRLFRLPKWRALAPELRYGLVVLGASLVVTFQYSLDVVFVKHFFSPDVAGLYAGVAGAARIIFFLTASFALVLMPLVRIDGEARANRRLLWQSILLVFLIGLPVVLIFSLLPEQIISILMGSAYLAAAHLLPKLSMAVFAVAVMNVVVLYYLALRRFWVLAPLVMGAFITYGLLLHSHQTLDAIVTNLLIGSLVMLGALAAWAASPTRKESV